MFNILFIGANWIEVSTERGVANVEKNDDDTWTVREDPRQRRFLAKEEAINSVHEIMGV